MDIAIVIKNLKEGDPKAFKELVYHYSGILMTVAKLYTRNKEDAEDVLQDAFISVYRKINQFQGSEEKAFVGWMKRIVTNAALSKYRKMRYEYESYSLDTITPQTEDPAVLIQYEYEELMMAIYDLPLNYKRIVGLYAIDGYSHKEIAELLNIRPGTSRSMYSRAIKKLKEKLSAKSKRVKCVGNE
ncbi:MAG: RNA polymerase sigma factor [Calothrix sp. MO_167.B42]|nr:RNA polymerase sigma factor [Calothrix sp. MO_167.B42]